MSKLFEELKKTQVDLEKRLREKGKQAFQEHFAEFFKNNPAVEAIRWTQYTPYFNDGDECHFGVSEVAIKGKLVTSKYPSDNADDFYDTYGLTNKTLKDNLQALNNDMDSMVGALEIAFGDHVEVTVTPHSINVEQYEHE